MQVFIDFLVNHWALAAAFVCILIVLIQAEYDSIQGGAAAISPQEVITKINKHSAVLIDLRDNFQFQKGHITGARNIPLTNVSDMLEKLRKYQSKPIILVGGSVQQASNIAKELKNQQFESVFLLKGGLEAWKSEDLPLSKA